MQKNANLRGFEMYEENEYLESDVVNAAAMQLLSGLSNNVWLIERVSHVA